MDPATTLRARPFAAGAPGLRSLADAGARDVSRWALPADAQGRTRRADPWAALQGTHAVPMVGDLGTWSTPPCGSGGCGDEARRAAPQRSGPSATVGATLTRLHDAPPPTGVGPKSAIQAAESVYRHWHEDLGDPQHFLGGDFDVDRPPGPCDPTLPFSVRLHNGCFPPTVGHRAVFATCDSPLITFEQKWALGCYLPEARELTCQRFNNPDCPDECLTNDAWIECEPPCLIQPQPCPIRLIPRRDVAAIHVSFADGGIDPEIGDLIATGWRFLQNNQDIVLWVCCLLDPTRQLSFRVHELLFALPGGVNPFGEPLPVHVIDEPFIYYAEQDGYAASSANPYYITIPATDCAIAYALADDDCGGVAVINHGESQWCQRLCTFNNGGAEDKCCTIINAATTLLHEVVNVATRRYPDIPVEREERDPETGDWIPGGCQASYWVHYAFAWAARIRYSDSTDATCPPGESPIEDPGDCGFRP